jgi:hypothetical protein
MESTTGHVEVANGNREPIIGRYFFAFFGSSSG